MEICLMEVLQTYHGSAKARIEKDFNKNTEKLLTLTC